MAFSGIEGPQDCQVIWTIFVEKKKNVEACRHYLVKGMADYAYNRRIVIDGGIYLKQDTMKSILTSTPAKVSRTFSLRQKDFLSFAVFPGPTTKLWRLRSGSWH